MKGNNTCFTAPLDRSYVIHVFSLRDVISILYAFISCPFITNPELTLFLNGSNTFSVADPDHILLFHQEDIADRSQLSAMMTMYDIGGVTGVSSTDTADLHRFTISYMPDSGTHDVRITFVDYQTSSEPSGTSRFRKHPASKKGFDLAEKRLLTYLEASVSNGQKSNRPKQ